MNAQIKKLTQAFPAFRLRLVDNKRWALMAGVGLAVAATAIIVSVLWTGNRGYVSLYGRQENLPVSQIVTVLDGEKLIGFVDGMVTDQTDLTDDLYEQAHAHNEQGCWQMIFGVNTLPEYRRQGVAAALLERAISDAKAQGRKGLVLTCKDKLVHYYAKFGFVSEGVSGSTHGGAVWYQMRLTF